MSVQIVAGEDNPPAIKSEKTLITVVRILSIAAGFMQLASALCLIGLCVTVVQGLAGVTVLLWAQWAAGFFLYACIVTVVKNIFSSAMKEGAVFELGQARRLRILALLVFCLVIAGLLFSFLFCCVTSQSGTAISFTVSFPGFPDPALYDALMNSAYEADSQTFRLTIDLTAIVSALVLYGRRFSLNTARGSKKSAKRLCDAAALSCSTEMFEME